MSQGVSFINTSKIVIAQNVKNPIKKTISKCISVNKSISEKKSNKNIVKKIINFFIKFIRKVKIFFLSVYNWIFSKKKIVIINKKNETELKLEEFKLKLEKVDSYSKELLLKEADKSIVSFNSLGVKIYDDYNIIRRFFALVLAKQYYDIGKEKAEKDYKALVPFLKKYYNDQIDKLLMLRDSFDFL